ncbi:MAG: transglutaminase domain-containing protein, partial [Acidobacteriota bacterium]
RALAKTSYLEALTMQYRNNLWLKICMIISLLLWAVPALAQTETVPKSATYSVNHSLTIKDIPSGSKKLRIWFWLPDDDDAQKLLDLVVTNAPADYKITRDPNYGHRYFYAEVSNPATTASITMDLLIRRNAVVMAVDAGKAGKLTDIHRKEFSEYLKTDVPNMEVSERIVKLANEVCGNETNVVLQARRIFDYIVDNSEHYSKSEQAPKSSGKGSAEYCLNMKGGACTDQHSLFIALARARGIPTRLHFGSRLQVKNEGKAVDPGYRCWVQYFVPNYGWVSMDISGADTNPELRSFYFSGLDERRIKFMEGRDLQLNPLQDAGRVNLVIGAYVEVDGKPHSAFERLLKFNTVNPSEGQMSVNK